MARYFQLIDKHDLLEPKVQKSDKETYWKTFKTSFNKNLDSAITSLEFSNITEKSKFSSDEIIGDNLFVSSGHKVTFFDETTFHDENQISRFKDDVICVTTRRDGKLIAAGGKENELKLFDPRNKQLLRVLRGHSDKINCVKFSNEELTRVTSFSEDQTIRHWDIPRDTCVFNLKTAHKGAVYSGTQRTSEPSSWISGGADKFIKLWDFRLKSHLDESKAVLDIATDFPVKKLQLVPSHSDSLIFATGGKSIVAFDLRKTGKELHRFKSHLKEVTDLSFNTECGQLVSGSLDCMVKAYDISKFEVSFQKRFESEVTSVSVSSKNNKIAVGTKAGKVHVLVNKMKKEVKAIEQPSAKRSIADSNVTVIGQTKRKKLAKYELDLKSFRYKTSLDKIFQNSRNPSIELASALFRELIERDALRIALKDRDEESISSILQFLIRNFFRNEHTTVFSNVLWIILEFYEEKLGEWPNVVNTLKHLNENMAVEMEAQKKSIGLAGVLATICPES